MTIPLDINKMKSDSEIYPNLKPGDFLYDYRKALNDAAFQIALADPTLLANKGELQNKAKERLQADGYQFKKKRSRSSQQETRVKTTATLRAKRIKEVQEDLEEVSTELKLLQRSRERARNVNCDEKARVYTQEMEPLRKTKRMLEDELEVLQKRSLQQKKRMHSSTKKECELTQKAASKTETVTITVTITDFFTAPIPEEVGTRTKTSNLSEATASEPQPTDEGIAEKPSPGNTTSSESTEKN